MQGCDVAGVDVVVHWKLPTSISSFAQRAGWAARGYGRTRLAVLLAEKSAYDVGLDERQSQKEENSKKKKRKGAYAKQQLILSPRTKITLLTTASNAWIYTLHKLMCRWIMNR